MVIRLCINEKGAQGSLFFAVLKATVRRYQACATGVAC